MHLKFDGDMIISLRRNLLDSPPVLLQVLEIMAKASLHTFEHALPPGDVVKLRSKL